jgi:hypothetical protein
MSGERPTYAKPSAGKPSIYADAATGKALIRESQRRQHEWTVLEAAKRPRKLLAGDSSVL